MQGVLHEGGEGNKENPGTMMLMYSKRWQKERIGVPSKSLSGSCHHWNQQQNLNDCYYYCVYNSFTQYSEPVILHSISFNCVYTGVSNPPPPLGLKRFTIDIGCAERYSGNYYQGSIYICKDNWEIEADTYVY
jgi:hypothetical protein